MSRYQFFFGGASRSKQTLERVGSHIILTMKTQAELAAQLSKVSQQLQKIAIESSSTLAKVADLQAALDNQTNVIPQLQNAVDALVKQVQLVDDLVPDMISNGSGVISNGSGQATSPFDPNAHGPGDSGNTTGNAGMFGTTQSPG